MTEQERIVRVALVDEQALWRRGIGCLLNNRRGFGLAQEGRSAEELARVVTAGRTPDVVVAGPGLGCSVDVAFRNLNRFIPAHRFIAMVAPGTESCAWYQANAYGYNTVSTLASEDEFFQALETVDAARPYRCPHVSQRVESSAGQAPRAAALANLSAREMEVLMGLLRGKRLKEIAGEMDVTQKSVHSYRTRMMDKLGLKNITDVVRYALHCGMLDPRPGTPPHRPGEPLPQAGL